METCKSLKFEVTLPYLSFKTAKNSKEKKGISFYTWPVNKTKYKMNPDIYF